MTSKRVEHQDEHEINKLLHYKCDVCKKQMVDIRRCYFDSIMVKCEMLLIHWVILPIVFTVLLLVAMFITREERKIEREIKSHRDEEIKQLSAEMCYACQDECKLPRTSMNSRELEHKCGRCGDEFIIYT